MSFNRSIIMIKLLKIRRWGMYLPWVSLGKRYPYLTLFSLDSLCSTDMQHTLTHTHTHTHTHTCAPEFMEKDVGFGL